MKNVKSIFKKNCCQRGFLFLEQRKVESLQEYLYIWGGFCLMVPVSSFAFVPRDKGWVGVFCLWVSMVIIITRPLHSATEYYQHKDQQQYFLVFFTKEKRQNILHLMTCAAIFVKYMKATALYNHTVHSTPVKPSLWTCVMLFQNKVYIWFQKTFLQNEM